MSDAKTLQESLGRLEELVTHQEHTLQTLNDELLRLRSEFEQTRQRLEKRIEALEGTIENQSLSLDPDERPPHY